MKNCEYYYRTMRNVSGPGELSRYKNIPTCALTEGICKFVGDCTKCNLKDSIHVKRYMKPHEESWHTCDKYGYYDDNSDIDYYCGNCHQEVDEEDNFCKKCGQKLK